MNNNFWGESLLATKFFMMGRRICLLGGESTGLAAKLFLMGRRISQFLARVEAPFHPASKENLAIFVQFVPKFQNPVSHDSFYRSFFNLNVLVSWSTLDGKKQRRSIFPKIPQANLSKNYASIYSMILQYYDRVQKIDKININQLKSPFRGNGQFGPNLAPNCDTLYLMIYSNVRIFFETLQHNGTEQVDSSISQFSRKISSSSKMTIRAQFGPELFNLVSHDLSLRYFLKHFSMMGHNRQTKVILVSLHRNPLSVQLGNLGSIWAKTMQPSLASNYVSLYAL